MTLIDGSRNIQLSLDERLAALGIHVGFMMVSGIGLINDDSEFDAVWREYQRLVLKRRQLDELLNHEQVAGYRALHQLHGLDAANLAPSEAALPESLIRTLFEHGELPTINRLVELSHYISLKTLVSIGVHDARFLEGRVSLRITNGGERFTPLGQRMIVPLKINEYAYITGDDEAICRFENFQSDQTKITDTTTECLFVIQGNASIHPPWLKTTAEDLEFVLGQYFGDDIEAKFVLLGGDRLSAELII